MGGVVERGAGTEEGPGEPGPSAVWLTYLNASLMFSPAFFRLPFV